MTEFEAVDLFLCLEEKRLERESEIVRNSQKEVIYNYPLFLGKGGLNPNSPDVDVHKATLHAALTHLETARAVGARRIVVASGPDPGSMNRETARHWFAKYLQELSIAAQPDIEVLVEPFDRSIGKNLLIGPTREAVELVNQMRSIGIYNLGVMVDMGHIPLLDESFQEAITLSAPCLGHVHLGNCVKADPDNPYYGDFHPPLGIEGGENDVEELAEFLNILIKIGYLNQKIRPTVTFEMLPYPNLDAEASVVIFLKKLEEAWGMVVPKIREASKN
ncbi:MAG: sugar phosphate isomerase/epimerase [Planctomycetes bacterium]|nr:sugar phosphate isomerase/epimerase [Planctomycetota bacterium]